MQHPLHTLPYRVTCAGCHVAHPLYQTDALGDQTQATDL